MAEMRIGCYGYLAGEAITAKRVVVTGDTRTDTVMMPDAANLSGMGIARGQAQEVIAIGNMVDVGLIGIYEVEAQAAVAVGDFVKIQGTSGKVIPCVGMTGHSHTMGATLSSSQTGLDTPEFAIGVAMTAAAADTDIIEVLMAPCVIA